MKNLVAAYIPIDKTADLVDYAAVLLNEQPKHHIDNLLWSTSEYKPTVSFAIAYTDNAILLKYYVTEQYIKATYQQINDPVYKDSCVEFFIAFDADANYYNLEFNLIGTALIAYGSGKNDRVYIDEAAISHIANKFYFADSGYNDDLYDWELTLNIPFTVFTHHCITSLKDQQCRVNFFKCGDDLPEPHFLSWNKIDHAEPNFHLPQFFGSIAFA